MTMISDEMLQEHQLVYAPHESLDTVVQEFPYEQELREAVSNHMFSLMLKHRGIGLAANQIALNASVFVQKIDKENVAVFNPQVHGVSENKVLMTEGCLSEPGLYLKIKRPEFIEVSWENVTGERNRTKLYGLNCRVFLHEFDHLQGVMFTDRVGATKLKMAQKKQDRALANFKK